MYCYHILQREHLRDSKGGQLILKPDQHQFSSAHGGRGDISAALKKKRVDYKDLNFFSPSQHWSSSPLHAQKSPSQNPWSIYSHRPRIMREFSRFWRPVANALCQNLVFQPAPRNQRGKPAGNIADGDHMITGHLATSRL